MGGFYLKRKTFDYVKIMVLDLQNQSDSLKNVKKEVKSLEERLSKLEKREIQIIPKTNIKIDFKKAKFYFKRAQEQGNLDGYCRIGLLYAIGQGVEINYFKSNKYK